MLISYGLLLLMGCISARAQLKAQVYKGIQQVNNETLSDGTVITKLRSTDFPYIIEVLEGNGHLCGGGLIKKNIAITAAHCFPRNISDEHDISRYEILAGNQLIEDKRSPYAQFRSVASIVSHRKYTHKEDGLCDLALVKVTQPFRLNQFVNIINLPVASKTYNAYAFESVITLGWGETEDGSASKILLKMHAYVEPTCQDENGTIVSEILCIMGFENATTCLGDSGSPHVIHRRDPKDDIIIGVTSGGPGKKHPTEDRDICDGAQATMVPNFSYFVDWIKKTIRKMSKHSR